MALKIINNSIDNFSNYDTNYAQIVIGVITKETRHISIQIPKDIEKSEIEDYCKKALEKLHPSLLSEVNELSIQSIETFADIKEIGPILFVDE